MFNILSNSWIPVVDKNSELTVITFSQLSNFDYVDIAWNRGDFRIASYELLIGLLTVLGAPRQSRTWAQLHETPPSQAILESWTVPLVDCFNLDGDGPRFLQDLEPLKGESVPPQSLLIDAPGGNTVRKNADFFVRETPHHIFSRAGAMMALYTLQSFAPSGGVGHRTSMRGGGPMTTLVVPASTDKPPSLWERLWAHVPVLTGDAMFPEDPDTWHRVFPWLAATRTSEKGQKVEQEQAHPLQAYFGMPRRIRLQFAPNETCAPCPLTGLVDDIVVTGYVTRNYGINYGEWNHPLTPYYRPKNATSDLPIHPKGGLVNYRDWIGIAFSANDDGAGQRKKVAQAVRDFRARLGDFGDDASILVAGYAMNNASVKEFVEATVPLFRAASDEIATQLDFFAVQLINGAQQAEARLRSELVKARQSEQGDSVAAAFARTLWTETEHCFRIILTEATSILNAAGPTECSDEPLRHLRERWRENLTEAALRLFDEAFPPEGLLTMGDRQAKEYTKARRQMVWLKVDAKFNRRLGLPPLPKRKRTNGDRA